MILLVNKSARRDYELIKEYQAGIALNGREVKSLRAKSGSLKEAYVRILSGEAYLVNAQITPYKHAHDNDDYDPKRSRKLLLRKKEVAQLAEASSQKNITIVPLSYELVRNKIKLNLALGRGKKQFEKRAQIKKRDQERDIRRQLKNRVRLR